MRHFTPLEEPRPPKRIRIWVEDALILLAIPVLWLTIFQLRGPVYTVITWTTLGVMIWVFVSRMKRFRQYVDERKKSPPPTPPM